MPKPVRSRSNKRQPAKLKQGPKISNPLKWHGGKSYLAKRIIQLMPPHNRYVEPYFGGGAVLFAKDPEGVAEFVNDINGSLMDFYYVLKNKECFDEFDRLVNLTPLSSDIFEQAKKRLDKFQGQPNAIHKANQLELVLRSVDFFVRFRQSRQALGTGYCTPTKRTRRGMNENVSAWLSAVEGLPEAHERLRRVELWHTDAIDMIEQLDTPDTLFYCDPPYLTSKRTSKSSYGQYEMSEEEHKDLLECLEQIEGKFILSGYKSRMYDTFAKHSDWNCETIKVPNSASSKKEKEIMVECLWYNY